MFAPNLFVFVFFTNVQQKTAKQKIVCLFLLLVKQITWLRLGGNRNFIMILDKDYKKLMALR